MIEYRKGSVFDATREGKSVVLAHACNCRGRWGSGVALSFKGFYPKAHSHYVESCMRYEKKNLGSTLLVQDGNAFVACMFTSDGYADQVDSVESILYNTELALKDLLHKASNLEIHMPKINSNLFRVPWEMTEALLLKHVPEGTKVVVWEL